MILEFSLKNYRSIQTLQTLNFVARPLREIHPWLKENVAEERESTPKAPGKVPFVPAGSSYVSEPDPSGLSPNLNRLPAGIQVLKSKAIYGPNSSGKSNLIQGWASFIDIVSRSVPDDGILNLIEPFSQDEHATQEPTFFQQIFVVEGVVYRYGFTATREKIVSEWLFGKPGKRETPFFTRDAEGLKVNKAQFEAGYKLTALLAEANDLLRPNALFLGASAALNVPLSKQLQRAITSALLVTHWDAPSLKKRVYDKLHDTELRRRIVRFLQEAGIDLSDLSIRKTHPSVDPYPGHAPQELLLVHKKRYDLQGKTIGQAFEAPFEGTESRGTQKLLRLASLILEALDNGRVLIIDEFEAYLHTEVSQAILKLFHSATSNPWRAQFVFSTHDTNLLSSLLLRRDQIELVEKNASGASQLFSLANYTGVRNDENYEKSYLGGRYGALPNPSHLADALAKNYGQPGCHYTTE